MNGHGHHNGTWRTGVSGEAFFFEFAKAEPISATNVIAFQKMPISKRMPGRLNARV